MWKYIRICHVPGFVCLLLIDYKDYDDKDDEVKTHENIVKWTHSCLSPDWWLIDHGDRNNEDDEVQTYGEGLCWR